MSERIAMMGGTFNPVHVGHVRLARAVVGELSLGRLLLVPCARPPHKTGARLAPSSDRLAMCRLAVEDDPRIEASDIELGGDGPSYTVDTLRRLGRAHRGAELLLVIGADMLRDLHVWRSASEVVSLARIVTLPRPGVDLGRLAALRAALGDEAADRLLGDVLATPLVDVSSSEVRRRVAAGEAIDDLVPAAVARYIAEHGLYQQETV